MTREKWEKMTGDERRIKVAMLCGWKEVPDEDSDPSEVVWFAAKQGFVIRYLGRDDFERDDRIPDRPPTIWKAPEGKSAAELCAPVYGHIPDYLNDLNAMHEVEKVFLQEDGCACGDAWEKYCDNLAKICFLAEPVNCLMRTTASQRAEAFVLTMDKE